MLDEVVVFRRNGVVLWNRTWASVKGDPVNQLIQKVLLEVRSGLMEPRKNTARMHPILLIRSVRAR